MLWRLHAAVCIGGKTMAGGQCAAPRSRSQRIYTLETKVTDQPPFLPTVGRLDPQPKHPSDTHTPLAGSLLYELERTQGRVLARPWAQ